MHLSISSVMLCASTAIAAAVHLPRQGESTSFILHSRLTNATDVNAEGASFGYVTPKLYYAYGYYGILDDSRADALPGQLTDTGNVTNSAVKFTRSDDVNLGLVLAPLTQEVPTNIAYLYSGQSGTKGVFVDAEGKLGFVSKDGDAVAWHACPNDQDLESGPATALGYKLTNAATPAGCYDIDLIVEYL